MSESKFPKYLYQVVLDDSETFSEIIEYFIGLIRSIEKENMKELPKTFFNKRGKNQSAKKCINNTYLKESKK